ncbi:MAG TPA: holo-ACP synthase [Syntrophorhabdaceae bacterium]|nr:holo-ACP synthase [Syntrophorhabdaceae bacterium]HQM80675.1 holo-ACP synthase [Syntrophorhabdaceae bacterium]
MVGIDIVDIARIKNVMERYGERFLNKVFTDEEIRYTQGKRRVQESLAGRFAAKEAFMKAMGRRLSWKEIEISQVDGRPHICYKETLYNGVSISHERTYAVSVVVIDERGRIEGKG